MAYLVSRAVLFVSGFPEYHLVTDAYFCDVAHQLDTGVSADIITVCFQPV